MEKKLQRSPEHFPESGHDPIIPAFQTCIAEVGGIYTMTDAFLTAGTAAALHAAIVRSSVEILQSTLVRRLAFTAMAHDCPS